MNITLGLLIIAIGAFCQSSCYVPINRIKQWSWESYWLIQGVFAWLIFPLIGALLAVPEGHSLIELFTSASTLNVLMTILFGILWGIGGLTFGLSMRYLGVALGQSIALGTCAGLGTIMGPVLLHLFFPEQNPLAQLTTAVLIGVAVTLIGIAIIGAAGAMKAKQVNGEKTNTEFNFPKGITIALLAGFMSGCFNVGLTFGADIHFEQSAPIFATLPATLLVTIGGFATNLIYCLYQNYKNKTFSDYKSGWKTNLLWCCLAGLLWYSQFFGLALGKGFIPSDSTLYVVAFCVLMALNVIFSNVWGIILKEWNGCNKKTIVVLIIGIAVLVLSCFLPQWI